MPTQVINGMSITPGSDSITTTDKITAGYFTGGDGTLASDAWTTASITDSVETYYYGIAKDSPTGSVQFHVAYGNANGKGSNSDSDNIKSPTEAIYNQWTNILLPEFEITGGFFISADKVQTPSDSHLSSGTRDTDFYVLLGQRSLFKDRINKKNWTIQLSGSSDIAGEAGLQVLSLTDDSQNIPPVYTPAGPRYNIVSGSSGTVVSASSKRNFGFFYPDQGVWLFSGAELSRSLPGTSGSKNTAVNFISKSTGTAAIGSKDAFGFQEPTTETSDLRQALRFVNCMKLSGSATHTTQTMRSEEDQTSVSYFCRATSTKFNFSNNPTFVSGSDNEIRNKTLRGNPTVYITGVELYNGGGDIVATGKLSGPLKKNFSTEAVMKVKLTF